MFKDLDFVGKTLAFFVGKCVKEQASVDEIAHMDSFAVVSRCPLLYNAFFILIGVLRHEG